LAHRVSYGGRAKKNGNNILDKSKPQSQHGNACGRIRALVSGLPSAKRLKRRLLAFQAFIDDSGSGVPVFVLSGYVSSVDWWEAFSDEWQALLDEDPKIPYFKMREAVYGFSRKMKPDERDERVKKFFHLIKLASHASVSCVIPMLPYGRIVKGKIEKKWDDPYFVAIFDVVTALVENQLNVEHPEPIDFIFDDNPRLAVRVPYWYQVTRQMLLPNQRDLMGASARFEDDKQFLPLQAADAQSWYFRRLFAERFKGEPFAKNLSKSLFAELDSIPSMLSFWSCERLQYMVEASERIKRGEKIGHRSGPPKPKRFKDIHDVIAHADIS
jgi:hypothetical protein